MTKLIPLDAAIGALEERRDQYRQDSQTWLQIQMDVQTIRAIPTIDPAAIREAAMREALDAVSRAAWKHNGDDSYSAGLEDGARNQNEADYDAILALIGEKK